MARKVDIKSLFYITSGEAAGMHKNYRRTEEGMCSLG